MNTEYIGLRIDKEMVEWIDNERKKIGLSRSAFIRMELLKGKDNNEKVEAEIEELKYELETQKENYENEINYYKENYKKMSPYEIYGISEEMFH